MTDGVEVSIADALIDAVLAYAEAASLSVSVPGQKSFTPPVPTVGPPGVIWLRVSLLPADIFPVGVSNAAAQRNLGFMQVDVMFQRAVGMLGPLRAAEAVKDAFARGTTLRKNGFRLDVQPSPSILPAQDDAPWQFYPVRVPYQCFSNPA